jgi:non-ribosomal peptide synthetase component F
VLHHLYQRHSAGKPKGVGINHSKICNFLSVVAPIYGVNRDDRVYQGMTIAFDFSIEEIWPTFAQGATLVAGPTEKCQQLGASLATFLETEAVTILYCVPTLLAR